jgi:hypothetical protein
VKTELYFRGVCRRHGLFVFDRVLLEQKTFSKAPCVDVTTEQCQSAKQSTMTFYAGDRGRSSQTFIKDSLTKG